MSTRAWIVIVVVLAIIIVALTCMLFAIPTPRQAPAVAQQATTSGSGAPVSSTNSAQASSSQTEPLDKEVSVETPLPNATVSHAFDVSGTAPNAWYFEAVFPIQVRDPNDNLVATAQAQAQSDWTQPGAIPFKASVTVDTSYSGPATLIILKDNPSGDPENSDEVTIPILIR